MEANRITDEIDSDEETEDIEPETEEDTDRPHPRHLKKKLTKSRVTPHGIESVLDPSNFDQISYLNKHGYWETFVSYFGSAQNLIK